MMSIEEQTGVVVLAAGASTRLGSPKQLVSFKGKPLLQHTLDIGSSINFGRKVLVLGAHAGEISHAMDMNGYEVVMNSRWQEGMGSSLRRGVEVMGDSPAIHHLLVLLSDQPQVSVELLRSLLKEHAANDEDITASGYRGKTGVPAIFSRAHFPELKRLTGDQGAKQLMSRYPVVRVAFPEGHVDVDTREDVDRLRRME
ncbi:NTP transferase domain-containing protein [Roseivirga sp. BDSF3-8]|uniref:nucleotidyltransferase family protein n=1 Tax=Roseivirga sp. BDSF3-8 TaxID=3241598 RepID=UPI003531D199